MDTLNLEIFSEQIMIIPGKKLSVSWIHTPLSHGDYVALGVR